jgi:hypothetical protein
LTVVVSLKDGADRQVVASMLQSIKFAQIA